MELIDDYLILADLHIGVEDVLELPFIDTAEVLKKKLFRLIEKYAPSYLVLAGDVRDGFDLNLRVLRKTREVLKEISALVDRVIIVRGNHDNFLRPIAKRLGIERHEDYFEIGDIIVVHGHREAPKAEKIIMGHIHPAIRLGSEVFPAKIYGRANDSSVIILPAITPIAKTRRGPTVDFSSPITKNLEVERIEVEIRGNRLILDKKYARNLLLRYGGGFYLLYEWLAARDDYLYYALRLELLNEVVHDFPRVYGAARESIYGGIAEFGPRVNRDMALRDADDSGNSVRRELVERLSDHPSAGILSGLDKSLPQKLYII